MRVLIDFVNSNPEFQNFVYGISSIIAGVEPEHKGYVQGVLLDLHPYWRDLWRLRGQDNLEEQLIYMPRPMRDHIDQILASDVGYDEYDVSWSPGVWKNYIARYKKTYPFLATIRVLPTTPSTLPIRRLLVDHAAQQNFFAIVEDREGAVLAGSVEGGVEIVASYSGTLGGFLEEGNVRYGLTCGHVATRTGNAIDVDDVGATRLIGAGKVGDSNYGSLGGQLTPQFCNPYTTTLPEVDAALIELDPAHTALNTVFRIGKIVKHRDRNLLSPAQTVTMRGVRSGRNDYNIGALAVSYRFFYNDKKYYCFTNLYEIKGKIPTLLNPRLAQPIAPRPRQGDSGAWVCALEGTRNGINEFSFCGTLTGVDRDVGYCSFSDFFINWSGKNLNCF